MSGKVPSRLPIARSKADTETLWKRFRAGDLLCRLDSGVRGTLAYPVEKIRNQIGRAGRKDLDGTVREVANGSPHAEPESRLSDPPAEADSLNATSEDQPSAGFLGISGIGRVTGVHPIHPRAGARRGRRFGEVAAARPETADDIRWSTRGECAPTRTRRKGSTR